ncbi:MAG: hypothetical protein WCK05_05515 [Planctomycetota bacterium]
MALLAAGAPEAMGQNQGALFSGRGQYASGTSLGDNIYGYGALSAGQYGSTGSALYSGISDPSNYRVGRTAGVGGGRRGPTAGMEDLGQPTRTTRGEGRNQTGPDDGMGMAPEMRDPLEPKTRASGQVLMVAQQYLTVIGANTADGVARGRTVTTFVPEVPGMFRDLMEQGQQALRAGQWKDVQRAVDAFSKAQLLTDHNPDVTLSLAHAHFIVARYSYSLPSEYIQQTLILMPDLPLVQLEPKTFFDSPDTYDKRMAILASHLKDRPGDPDALLVLAYFKWFEPGGAQAAADALRQAWISSRRPRALGLGAMTMSNLDTPGSASSSQALRRGAEPGTESPLRVAIDLFWKGMVRSGKISGSLEQPADPGAGSRPTSPSPAPDENADTVKKEKSDHIP